MLPGGQGGRRAAAGEASAADFPEGERVTGDDVSAARPTTAGEGSRFCRGVIAGRGMAFARSTERETLASAPRESLGSVPLEARAQAGYRRPR